MHSNFSQNFDHHSEYKRPLILAIDDDRDNLLLVSCVIESMGLNFAVSNNSRQCLPLVKELLPDIILLNIVMPNLNGLEIARILKQSKNFAAIPLLAITGLTKDEDKKRVMQAGFDDYLAKPYLIEDLEAKLLILLQNRSV